MKSSEFFLILTAVYVAPHLDKFGGLFFGTATFIVGLYYMIRKGD